MNEESVLYVGVTQSKSPLEIEAVHPAVGTYRIKTEPTEWKVVNKTGQAKWENGKFTGVAAGEIDLIAKVSFGDGSSLETTPISVNVKFLVPTEIRLVPRVKAAA